MGYGRYYIGFVQARGLKKEFLAGFLAASLARAIGNDKDPAGVRVLDGPKLEPFRKGEQVRVQKTKEERVSYWMLAS